MPQGSEAPAKIEYLGDWQNFETPGDTQTVTRRWLGQGGGLAIEPVREPLRLSLRFSLLEEIMGSDLAGSGKPYAKLVGTCGPEVELGQLILLFSVELVQTVNLHQSYLAEPLAAETDRFGKGGIL